MSGHEISTAQRRRITDVAARLQREYGEELDPETIERCVTDSLEALLSRPESAAPLNERVEHLANDRLRSLVRLEGDPERRKPSVLFLCVHNAGRSQMGAGWMRRLGGDRVDVFSGGSDPGAQINEAAVVVMDEKGIDITAQLPQPWADEIVRAADVVVSMGCGDVCPVYPAKRYVDWEIDDPAGRDVAEVRGIRDEIEQRVRRLLGELGIEPTAPW